jgi:hypothetical protein
VFNKTMRCRSLAVAVLVVAVLAITTACRRREAATSTPTVGLSVPRSPEPIKIDGDWDEESWSRRAARAQFVGDDRELARPSSEVRFLHDDSDLLVALYAADQDIQSSDAFDLTVGTLALHVDTTGRVTPAVPGVRASVGYDEGTRDNPRDDDEEWVVELAIPRARLGAATGGSATGGPLAVTTSRCDVPKDGIRRCGHWAGSISLE